MLARRRRENERRKKMDDAFTKADENGNGMITPQQMVKLFEANDCTGSKTIFNGKFFIRLG